MSLADRTGLTEVSRSKRAATQWGLYRRAGADVAHAGAAALGAFIRGRHRDPESGTKPTSDIRKVRREVGKDPSRKKPIKMIHREPARLAASLYVPRTFLVLEARSTRQPYMLGGRKGDPGSMPPRAGVTKRIKQRTSRAERRGARQELGQGAEPTLGPQSRTRGKAGTRAGRSAQWADWSDVWGGRSLSKDPKASRK